MTFSVATLAQQLESRRQALSIVGSLLVHMGFAVYLLQPAPNAPVPAAVGARGEPPGTVTVTLFRPTPQPAASAAAAPTPSLASAVALIPDAQGPEAPATSPATAPASAPKASSATADQAGATSGASVGHLVADVSGTLGSDYQRRLLAHIEPFKRYPDDASRTGVRGVVQLTFQIDRDGRVLGVWVARSSGSQALDLAAVDTVRRAAPLPPIPVGLPDNMAVQLPVEFSGPG